MLKRICIAVALVWALITMIQPAVARPDQGMGYFDAIDVSSDSSSFDIHLVTRGAKYPAIRLANTYAISIADIAEVQNHTLILHPPNGNTYPDVISLTIFAPQLHQIRAAGPIDIHAEQLDVPYLDVELIDSASLTFSGKRIPLRTLNMSGHTNVRANGIYTHDISLTLKDDSHAVLLGRLGLRQLIMTGNSRLKAYWIDGQNTQIELHHSAAAFLAGKTHSLDVNLFDKSYLDGKFLRAFLGYIQTHQRTRADVSVGDTLNSQSHDESDIYYYRRPRQNNEFITSQGAILNMSEIGQHGYPIP